MSLAAKSLTLLFWSSQDDQERTITSTCLSICSRNDSWLGQVPRDNRLGRPPTDPPSPYVHHFEHQQSLPHDTLSEGAASW